MAVPSSGELELYGDIGTELGVAQSNVTLHGMSQTAGFSAPDAMSEFYGYSGVSSPLSTVIYSGTGTDVGVTQSITGVGFQPDLVWVKSRTSGAFWHNLADSVRGVDRRLFSNTNNAEDYDSSGTYTLLSFDSDGFTVGRDNNYNSLGTNNYVAWCFKAGGAAVTNNDGTISSQVSANVEQGFSIVSYTGVGSGSNRTVGHGLNQAPEIIIVKNRDGTQGWLVWTTLIDGSSDYLFLNSTGPKDNSGQALPTSTVFNIQNDGGGESNANGNRYIGYCFHSISGVSKFGTYTGNGSFSGNTISTSVNGDSGFKPAFVMIKCTTVADYWIIFDNKRGVVSNNTDTYLLANISQQESDLSNGDSIDFLTNGFRVIGDGRYFNQNQEKYIYMAFV